MSTSRAYLNGRWIPSDEVTIALNDFGFLMGLSVVERLRTFGGNVFRSEDHLQRLRRSLDIVGWNVDSIIQDVATAIAAFPEQNNAYFEPADDWNVVCFVTPGTSWDGAEPTICVHGHPIPFASWADQYATGVSASTVNTRQIPENCWPSELKCRSRMHYYLADREAQLTNPGSRGILLDQDGFIGEGTTANVVAYFADRGFVTPFRSKVLPGVSQQVLFELAKSLGIPCSETDILPTELARADEILFVSTSICLLPVTQLDGQAVGSGIPGPKYQQLLAAWSELVGVNISAQAKQFSQR